MDLVLVIFTSLLVVILLIYAIASFMTATRHDARTNSTNKKLGAIRQAVQKNQEYEKAKKDAASIGLILDSADIACLIPALIHRINQNIALKNVFLSAQKAGVRIHIDNDYGFHTYPGFITIGIHSVNRQSDEEIIAYLLGDAATNAETERKSTIPPSWKTA